MSKTDNRLKYRAIWKQSEDGGLAADVRANTIGEARLEKRGTGRYWVTFPDFAPTTLAAVQVRIPELQVNDKLAYRYSLAIENGGLIVAITSFDASGFNTQDETVMESLPFWIEVLIKSGLTY
jgi:hypothetical protein